MGKVLYGTYALIGLSFWSPLQGMEITEGDSENIYSPMEMFPSPLYSPLCPSAEGPSAPEGLSLLSPLKEIDMGEGDLEKIYSSLMEEFPLPLSSPPLCPSAEGPSATDTTENIHFSKGLKRPLEGEGKEIKKKKKKKKASSKKLKKKNALKASKKIVSKTPLFFGVPLLNYLTLTHACLDIQNILPLCLVNKEIKNLVSYLLSSRSFHNLLKERVSTLSKKALILEGLDVPAKSLRKREVVPSNQNLLQLIYDVERIKAKKKEGRFLDIFKISMAGIDRSIYLSYTYSSFYKKLTDERHLKNFSIPSDFMNLIEAQIIEEATSVLSLNEQDLVSPYLEIWDYFFLHYWIKSFDSLDRALKRQITPTSFKDKSTPTPEEKNKNALVKKIRKKIFGKWKDLPRHLKDIYHKAYTVKNKK